MCVFLSGPSKPNKVTLMLQEFSAPALILIELKKIHLANFI